VKIVIDTSVWIECLEDQDLKKRLMQIAEKHEAISSVIVDTELKLFFDSLKEHNPSKAEELMAFYTTTRKTPMPNENLEALGELAGEYLSTGVKLGLPVRGMKADLSIVAEASLAHADAILSLNRKSMASDYAKLTYLIVNKSKNLQVPTFVSDKHAIRKFASA
jgi:predicted nucleic acid-binding protein